MEEKNPTPINFMYLNSNWEQKQKQKENAQCLENITDLLEILVIFFKNA